MRLKQYNYSTNPSLSFYTDDLMKMVLLVRVRVHEKEKGS